MERLGEGRGICVSSPAGRRVIVETIAEIDGLCLRRVDLGGASEIPAYQWRYQLRPSALDAGGAEDLPRPQTLAASIAVTSGEPEPATLHATAPFLHPTRACARRRDGREPRQN